MSMMTVGFAPPYLESFQKHGAPVAIFIHSGMMPASDAEPMVLNESVRFKFLEGGHDPELDIALANKVRQKALPVYFRTCLRAANQENAAPPTWNTVHYWFENALNYYSKLLRERNIKTVIFWIFPHEGNFYVLYELARALGLETVICFQSIFPHAFYIFGSIEEYGQSPIESGHGLEIPFKDNPEPPFYIQGMQQRTSVTTWIKGLGGAALDVAMRTATLQFLWRRYSMRKSVTKFQRKYRKLAHEKAVAEATTADIGDKPFIYFPLHVQPEASADVLGDRYCDQLLAIEEMRRLAPPEYAILVKENPRQTTLARGKFFFQRLQSLPNVRLMPHHVSTIKLGHKARIVGCITGTAGYEALQMGKPVLCFGNAWYRGLPGVFDWRADPQAAMQAALAFKYDRETLKEAVATRSRVLWRGLLDPYYLKNTPQYDPETNVDTVVEGIVSYRAAAAAGRRAA